MKKVLALAAFAAFTALTPSRAVAAPGPRSQDDRGFSIRLVSPTDIYLTGRRTMRIEAIIPRGDTIEQVDFFVDGRLAFIDVREPYSHEADFGDDIRRHTIEVRALTHQGRRAKVSMVSRSTDLTERAVGRVETLAVMVRDAAGHPVDGLSVSDFRLSENGTRQPVVHFEGGGSPSSLALIVAASGPFSFRDLNDRLATFLRGLPHHHAVLVVDGAAAEDRPGSAAFSYDLDALADRTQGGNEAAGADALPDRLSRAAAALEGRRGARVLLVLAPPESGPAPDSEAAESTATAAGASRGAQPRSTPPPPDPLEQALQSVRRTQAVVYGVALGAAAHPGGGGRLEEASSKSGGRYLPAADLPALEQALVTVAEALRHRYLISYMPADPDRPGDRQVEVSTLIDGLAVEAPQTLELP